jgi:hypothetical protein
MQRQTIPGDRVVRWLAVGLTVIAVVVLTPWVVADSGVAAAYLLGVPLAAVAIVAVADLTGRAVGPCDAIGAVVLLVWGFLLALGIGFAFVPSGLLLIGAGISGAAARRRRRSA